MTTDTHPSHPPLELLTTYLEARLVEIRRQTRRIRHGGAIVALLLAIVLSAELCLVRWLLQPANAADAVVGYLTDAWPGLLHDLHRELARQAPVSANAVAERAMAVIPCLRRQAEREIELTYRERIPELQVEECEALRAYIRSHRDEIVEHYQQHHGAQFRARLLDMLGSRAVASLDQRLRQPSMGRGADILKHLSLEGLRSLDQHLARLVAADAAALTRRERLQRRLIVSWLHLLEESVEGQN
ncbi:MAG: hypothetical protein JXR37_19965 [Kiritimatiellae bacterium]|nr:hypothetical protein [Kiritimatiellia bacterium]